jgi:hypothetical protein
MDPASLNAKALLRDAARRPRRSLPVSVGPSRLLGAPDARGPELVAISVDDVQAVALGGLRHTADDQRRNLMRRTS